MNSPDYLSQFADALILEDQLVLGDAIDQFLGELSEGSKPRIENFIIMDDIDSKLNLVLLRELVVAEVFYREERGESITIESLLVRFPTHSNVIQSGFEKAARLTQEGEQKKDVPPTGYGEWVPWGIDLGGDPVMVKRGGFGDVRISEHDPKFARRVAVKLLQQRYREFPFGKQMIEAEAAMLGQLDHPAIPPVFDCCANHPQNVPYFSMRYIEGQTLTEVISKSDGKSLTQLIEIISRVAEAIGYCHANGIIHRDLKPDNVLVGSFGEVQVIDWGLSWEINRASNQVDSSRTLPEQKEMISPSEQFAPEDLSLSRIRRGVVGTPSYMSKEQANGKIETLTAASDVFSLGAILCELLTGHPPYSPTGERCLKMAATADLTVAYKRLESFRKQHLINSELVDICKKCLSNDPKDRFADCGELARAITDHQESVSNRLEQKLVEDGRRKTRNTLGSMIVVLLVCLATFLINSRVKSNQRDAEMSVGSLQLNGTISNSLSKIENDINRLTEDQKSRDGWRALRDDVPSWDKRLEAIEIAIQEAKAIYDSTSYIVKESNLNALARFQGRYEELEYDRQKVWESILRIREETFVKTLALQSSPFPNKDVEYRDLFRNLLDIDVDNRTQEEIVDSILKTRTHWLWIDTLDDFANDIERSDQIALRRKLRNAAIALDDDGFANRIRGLDLSHAEDVDEAKELAGSQQILETSTELISLVVAELRQHQLEKLAVEILVEIAYHQRNDFFLWMTLANFVEAPELKLRALTAALSTEPVNYIVHYQLGMHQYDKSQGFVEKSDWSSAIESLERAESSWKLSARLASGPVRSLIYHNLGILCEDRDTIEKKRANPLTKIFGSVNSEHINQALVYYRKAVDIFPANSFSWNNIGTIQELNKEFKKAEESYRKAVEANPKRTNSLINLAQILLINEHTVEAAKYFEAALETDNESIIAWHNLAVIHANKKHYDQAVEHFRKVIELCSKNKEYGADHQYARYARQEIRKLEPHVSEM